MKDDEFLLDKITYEETSESPPIKNDLKSLEQLLEEKVQYFFIPSEKTYTQKNAVYF